jgi:hypothetical protein
VDVEQPHELELNSFVVGFAVVDRDEEPIGEPMASACLLPAARVYSAATRTRQSTAA